jgi:hypothetical protein
MQVKNSLPHHYPHLSAICYPYMRMRITVLGYAGADISIPLYIYIKFMFLIFARFIMLLDFTFRKLF